MILALILHALAVTADAPLLAPPYRWDLSPPLVAPVDHPDGPCISVKDPTVVFHDGQWHLFWN